MAFVKQEIHPFNHVLQFSIKPPTGHKGKENKTKEERTLLRLPSPMAVLLSYMDLGPTLPPRRQTAGHKGKENQERREKKRKRTLIRPARPTSVLLPLGSSFPQEDKLQYQ